jgi:hypothetical protein
MRSRIKRWTKKEMQDSNNWDFSYCSEFPKNLQELIFNYEITRDKKVFTGLQPPAPFQSDENNIKELIHEHIQPQDLSRNHTLLSEVDKNHDITNLPTKSGIKNLDWEDFPTVTFHIDPIFLYTKDYDAKLKSEFRKWISNKRSAIGYFDGKKIKNYYYMLRNLAFFRLRNAKLDRSSPPGKECETIYRFFPRSEYSSLTRMPGNNKKRRKPFEEIWQERSKIIEDYLNSKK